MKRLYDEDQAQDVCLKAWRKLDACRAGEFAKFVNNIIAGVRIDAYRTAKEHEELSTYSEEVLLIPAQPEIIFPCKRSERAFTLKAYGYSNPEVALAIGVTVGSLEVLLARWRKKIIVMC
ncbi:MAG: hypothetical protein WBX19_14105 [Terracidiphilus sp.]